MRSLIRTTITILIGVIAFGCQRYSEPEAALHSYAGAVREARCSDALELVSARTRYALEALIQKPQHPQSPLPLEEYYCNKFAFEDCKVDELTLKSLEGDAAAITMSCGRTQDSFIPGFPSIFLKYEPREFELVREGGHWRVSLPMVIRIIEVREREDQMREKALREQRELVERKRKSDLK